MMSFNATSKILYNSQIINVLIHYRNNKATPLDCRTQVLNFKASVERVERRTIYNRS